MRLITWVQEDDSVATLARPVVEISDGYETYYASTGEWTEAEAVDSFVSSYAFNEDADRAEMEQELRGRLLSRLRT